MITQGAGPFPPWGQGNKSSKSKPPKVNFLDILITSRKVQYGDKTAEFVL